MNPSRFDELTKALATPTSRRQALKTLAATTLGSLLGLAGIGTTHASSPTCYTFCNAVFGSGTAAAHQCINDSAQQKGLCYTCGPASPGGGVSPSAICCPRTSRGTCSTYGSASCCGSSSTCLNSSCCATSQVCGSICCGSNRVCSNGICCPTGQTNCGGTCVDTNTNHDNCGSCGHACTSGQTCQNGTCVTPCTTSGGTCGGDTECCSGTCCQGTCCGSGQVCLSNGSCATPCSDQAVPCNGSCGQGTCLANSSDTAIYCRGSGTFIKDCTADSDCPKGYFCSIGDGCVPLC